MASIEAKGRDGTVTFDGEWLTITRAGFTAVMMRGGRGDMRLHIGQITGVEIRKPGLTVGHFTVIAPGAVPPKRGMRAHNENPLSVMIPSGKRLAEFEQVRRAVEQAIAERSRPQPAVQAGPSIPEQLAHLAHLRDQGVLSAEEFQAAKARLIGG